MPDGYEIVTILDTTVGDSGPQQNVDKKFIQQDIPLRFHCNLGSGDTILIQGRLADGDSWDTLHTFTDETPADIYVSAQFRAHRSVDGGNDSTIKVQNPYVQALTLTTHT